MEKKQEMSVAMTQAVKGLNLAARGLFFEIYAILEQQPTGHIACQERDLAERLNVKFPHFSKSLKILVRKRILKRTENGFTCPYMQHAKVRQEIRKIFSNWKH